MKIAEPVLMSEEPAASKPRLKTAPLFVVGPLRSGTSLLYALLNQHPEIALMYECDVWNFPAAFSRLRFRGDWRGRLEFYSRPFSRHRLIMGESFRGLEKVRTPHDLYRAFADTRVAGVFGEKSPFYCIRLPELAQNHPGASFILIWRDPAEVYRSVADAAQRSSFFRRRGMLSRFIYFQEKMIEGAASLTRSGARVHHITYNDLIDRTEDTCRGLCSFLEIEFDSKMLDLKGADLSAVFRAPQHQYLRRGKIERRTISANDASPRVIAKLERYRNRWNRLTGKKFNCFGADSMGAEPSVPERLYDRVAGRCFRVRDDIIRVCFEFLPLSWLRTYRQVKFWFKAGGAAALTERRPLREEFLANKITVVLSLLLLAGLLTAHHLIGFAVSLMPFYIVPSALLTLVINRRWGTLCAAVSTLAWAALQMADNPIVNSSHVMVWLWDAFMRFLLVEMVVLLLDRIRLETRSERTFPE